MEEHRDSRAGRRIRDQAQEVRLGTTWGPHVLPGGEQPARRPLTRTALASRLTRINAYSHVLGVKWAFFLVITQGAEGR
jgi:hypothetical protein